ncbi:hypothetical protein A374_16864 [Fictibacillus macauensis ZFHKF-1]|uniref:Uncharacterized protein n=1 Tax=Fictibacillus macauensis ZFHKF-1 TaxID=1196324 RepID=I8IXC8_9BACL|nr:DUF1433 domain-containing protein [Fictibacillus macauensis]EIT84136.1 hypothetical protein A374_16864 [Fictibacillus macauensis ZFHKF-1]
MKKKLWLSISLLLLLLIAVPLTMKHYNDQAFWQSQEKRVKKYILHNIKGARAITFKEREESPMGIPYIAGYVNDNKKLNFTATIYEKNFEDDFNCSPELNALSTLRTKPVSEIEKEETEKGYRQERINYFAAQKKRIETFIHYNLNDVTSITFTRYGASEHLQSYIFGYINHKKELWFKVSLPKGHFEREFEPSKKVQSFVKPSIKTFSEIEQEKDKIEKH